MLYMDQCFPTSMLLFQVTVISLWFLKISNKKALKCPLGFMDYDIQTLFMSWLSAFPRKWHTHVHANPANLLAQESLHPEPGVCTNHVS